MRRIEKTKVDSYLTDLKILNLYFSMDKDLKILTPNELKVLSLYFGLNGRCRGTLVSVGKQLNLSRERIRQIKFKAMRKILFFLVPSLHDTDAP